MPADTTAIFSDADPERAARAMQAMLRMRKLNLAELRAAGGTPEDRTRA